MARQFPRRAGSQTQPNDETLKRRKYQGRRWNCLFFDSTTLLGLSPLTCLRGSQSVHGECFCECIAPRAPIAQQERVGYFTLIGDEVSPAARDRSEAVRTLNRRCYPHTGNGGHKWCLNHSLSLSIGFSIQNHAMDAALSAQQEAHYLANVIYLLS